MDLQFLPERKRHEKVEKHIANIHYKTEYVAHVKSLKGLCSSCKKLKRFIDPLDFNKE